MRSITLKIGTIIPLEPGMEYEVMHDRLVVYDTRYSPEKSRTFKLDNVQSWGDDLE
jgi:uncharacterized protein (UPF0128 family)